MIASDQANMRECANLCRALASAFLVPLEEVAELRVVLPLLLLDRHNVLERLAEVLEMQVQVLLVCGELANLFRKDRYVALLEVFNDGERCTVGCQDVDQLGLELLLHELGQVALRAQKDLQLFRLGEIAQRSALLQEKIEEVPALTDHCIVLFSA